jgi:hypothetical protein
MQALLKVDITNNKIINHLVFLNNCFLNHFKLQKSYKFFLGSFVNFDPYLLQIQQLLPSTFFPTYKEENFFTSRLYLSSQLFHFDWQSRKTFFFFRSFGKQNEKKIELTFLLNVSHGSQLNKSQAFIYLDALIKLLCAV